MRKYLMLAALLAGAAIVAIPVSPSQAIAHGWYYVKPTPPPPPKPQPTGHGGTPQRPARHWLRCRLGGVADVRNRHQGQRQERSAATTITEAGWASAACPSCCRGPC